MLSDKSFAGLPENPRIVIALSGGPDSMFLTTELLTRLPRVALSIAHFDHALRKDSAHDAEFCRRLAELHQVSFFCERWKHPESSEEKARNARRQFLFTVRDSFRADAVAIGTHADDLAETLFFRFLRGSGIAGLAGIKPFDRETKFWRPLLHLKKSQILESLEKRGVLYLTDNTNLLSDYSRNFIRNEVFPMLEQRFTGFSDRLIRQSEIFRMADDYLRAEAEAFLAAFPEDVKNFERKVSREDFAKLPQILKLEVIRLLLLPRTIDSSDTLELSEFLETANAGKQKNFKNLQFLVFAHDFFIRRSCH